MEEDNPEIQEQLKELDRELEVSNPGRECVKNTAECIYRRAISQRKGSWVMP